MIQLNLLPDVKLEFMKAQRMRRLVLLAAIVITAAAIAVLVVLLVMSGLQKRHLSNLNDDIKDEISSLTKEKDISKVLTIQNQLDTLAGLHASKPAANRVFGYLNQTTPTTVDITDLSVKFTEKTLTITGTADSLGDVNKYIDTLKFAVYKVKGVDERPKAFSNVVMSAYGLSEGAEPGTRPVTYTIDAVYDPNIFDVTKTVELIVPTRVTTRPLLTNESDLFQNAPTPSSNGNAPANGSAEGGN